MVLKIGIITPSPIMEIVHTGNLGALDAQYQAINFQEWKTKDDCQAEQFWAEVLNCKTAVGSSVVMIMIMIFICHILMQTLITLQTIQNHNGSL